MRTGQLFLLAVQWPDWLVTVHPVISSLRSLLSTWTFLHFLMIFKATFSFLPPLFNLCWGIHPQDSFCHVKTPFITPSPMINSSSMQYCFRNALWSLLTTSLCQWDYFSIYMHRSIKNNISVCILRKAVVSISFITAFLTRRLWASFCLI